MGATFRLVCALGLVSGMSSLASAAPPKAKAAGGQKEISADDKGLQKQMDWENKLLGPNTEKKIDLAKIQKLQAEEAARREKQQKVDAEKKEREAALAAQRKDVRSPSTRDVPNIEEAPK